MKLNMKKIIKQILSYILASDYDSIQKKTERFDCISFDVFDTLLVRKISSPENVFQIVKEQYEKETGEYVPDFVHTRICIEQNLIKKSKSKTTTFDKIYDQIAYVHPEYNIKVLKNLELMAEKAVVSANPKMYDIFQFCINKQVFITSDMYLPTWFIRDLLINAGYSVSTKQIFVSGDCKASKRDGQLFVKIRRNNDKARILHIGDDVIRDYLIPKTRSISSVLLKR